MTKLNWYRVGAAPVLLAGLAAPAVFASGCGDSGLECEAGVTAKVEAFQVAVDALVSLSAEIKADVYTACQGIATELGSPDAPTKSAAEATDDDVTAACNAASAAIDASIQANGSISVQIVGGKCEVAASAQFECEASCDVNGECTPGSIEARCDPGELSGECSAVCEGSCTVETGSVECAGSCSGTCNGECTGECQTMGSGGQCAGKCEGTCNGGCTGTCEVLPPSGECSGSCKGGCSVSYTAPSCEGEITPPACNIDAECQAGCEGQAELKAECTPPSITIEGNAELKGVLEAHLPTLILIAEVRGKALVDAAGDVAGKAVGVAEAAVTIPACAAKFGADLVAKFTGAVSASASVSVSVSASASASGSATGGA